MITPVNDNHPPERTAADLKHFRFGCLIVLLGGLASWAFVIWAVIMIWEALP